MLGSGATTADPTSLARVHLARRAALPHRRHRAPQAKVRVHKPGALRFADTVRVVIDRTSADFGEPAVASLGEGAMTATDVRRMRSVRHELATRDLQAAAALLRALGISLTGESLADTPGRMARAYAELLTRDFDPRTFPNEEGYQQLVDRARDRLPLLVPEAVPLSSPWDMWWAAYRALVQIDQLGIRPTRPGIGCADCGHDALALAASSPPRHPDAVGGRPTHITDRLPWLGPDARPALRYGDDGIAPPAVVNAISLLSLETTAPPLLRAGIWPIHPFTHPGHDPGSGSSWWVCPLTVTKARP